MKGGKCTWDFHSFHTSVFCGIKLLYQLGTQQEIESIFTLGYTKEGQNAIYKAVGHCGKTRKASAVTRRGVTSTQNSRVV